MIHTDDDAHPRENTSTTATLFACLDILEATRKSLQLVIDAETATDDREHTE